MSLSWDLFDEFLMIRLKLWVWGRKTAEVKCCVQHVLSRVQAISMNYNCRWCPWSPGWGAFVVTPFCPFLTACSLGEGIDDPCQWWESLYINYLEFFFMGYFSILPCLFIQFFIYIIWTHRYLFYTLSYNPIVHYLFCCSNSSSFIWALLFWIDLFS